MQRDFFSFYHRLQQGNSYHLIVCWILAKHRTNYTWHKRKCWQANRSFFGVVVVALYVSVFMKCLVTAATSSTADKVINLNFHTKPEHQHKVTHANPFSKPGLPNAFFNIHFLDETDRHRLRFIAIYDMAYSSHRSKRSNFWCLQSSKKNHRLNHRILWHLIYTMEKERWFENVQGR